MDLYDEIYAALTGQMEAGSGPAGIPNAFAPGSECDQAYTRLLEARNRVLAELGQENNRNLEQMLEEMEHIQYVLCRYILELRRM